MKIRLQARICQFALVMLIALGSLGFGLASARADCVSSVSSHDVLWLRDGPGTRYSRIAAIPHNACDIELIGGCSGEWCAASWSGVSGWLNTRYLSSNAPVDPVTINDEGYDHCVTGVAANDVLWLRSGPGTGYARIRGIPSYSCGVAILSECNGNWCQADFDGQVGWINMGYVRRGG